MTAPWRVEEAAADPAWMYEDELFADERSTSYPPDTLVTVRFLWDAVRRHARLWFALALIGLAGGLAMPAILPPGSESSAKLVLTHRDGDDPARAMATDVGLITTHSVAQLAIEELGLADTPDELLERYRATQLTDRVLEITASAPSSEEATELAAAVADIYLEFRNDQIALQEEPLRQDLAAARTAVAEAEAAVEAAGGDPRDPDPPPSPEATTLTRAAEEQRYIEQQILDQQVVAARMSSSHVLDVAAPVPDSSRRALLINAGTGLAGGLLLGVGFVVVRALVSDRLWRRQDIARVLGARVRLSVGRPPRVRWRPFPQYVPRSQMQQPEVRLVVQHLRATVSWDKTAKPALAIVSIDNVQASALIVASLAMSFADEGKRVLVADLSGTGALAAALGVTSVGTHEPWYSAAGARVTVHLPTPDAGPAEQALLTQTDASDHFSADENALDAAWVAADLVLTLATLSPGLGAEHLRTWAAQATAMVTAGRSTEARIRATGEMVRLAGIRLDSAVILRADRTDESVGVVSADTASATLGASGPVAER